jgi:hypothetical protein
MKYVHKFYIDSKYWCIGLDPLLGKHIETNNTTAIAMQRLRDRRIYNDRSWATARKTRNNILTLATRYFLCGPCRDVMSRTVWSNQFSWALQGRLRWDGAIVELTVDKSYARAAMKKGLEPWNWQIFTVKVVARERLVRAQQTGKGLADAVICEVWRLAIALWLLVVPSCVYKWSINPFTNPYTVRYVTVFCLYYSSIKTGSLDCNAQHNTHRAKFLATNNSYTMNQIWELHENYA